LLLYCWLASELIKKLAAGRCNGNRGRGRCRPRPRSLCSRSGQPEGYFTVPSVCPVPGASTHSNGSPRRRPKRPVTFPGASTYALSSRPWLRFPAYHHVHSDPTTRDSVGVRSSSISRPHASPVLTPGIKAQNRRR
jgi:hypothetical protein